LEPLFSANHPIYISTLTELELFSHASMTEEEDSVAERSLPLLNLVEMLYQPHAQLLLYRGR
jgi:hypothetical protein